VGAVEQVDAFITDSAVEPDMISGLKARGCTVHTIKREDSTSMPQRKKWEEK